VMRTARRSNPTMSDVAAQSSHPSGDVEAPQSGEIRHVA
jgi:hypothetical protein